MTDIKTLIQETINNKRIYVTYYPCNCVYCISRSAGHGAWDIAPPEVEYKPVDKDEDNRQ